ncbi:MAG: NADH-quinone oxidoreductase subunit NuoH [Anaerolineales bacterium]|nr:NADH-quinone oxidoreductase subunit NuoH [Anaerolineales bacterium]
MGDPFGLIGQWLMDLVTGWGMQPVAALTLLRFLGAAILATVLLLTCFLLIVAERKILGRFQDRYGPNRVGPWGVFQTVADFVKLIGKEIVVPDGIDKPVYWLAPLLVVMSVVGIWAVVPFAPGFRGTDLNVGILYIVSIGAIGTLGIIMAGWSSNNKFALLGAFRAVAQLVSYEIPMVLALLVPTMLAGSMGVSAIVEAQKGVWFIAVAPLAALVFLISSVAETGRAPFDLMEGESEIVAGFNIEYGGLAFGMFYVGEFLHAFTVGVLFSTLFLGGWQGPGAEQFPLLGLVYFLAKALVVWFVTIWVRGSFPRVRIDQLLALNWKFLVPLALLIVSLTAVVDKLAVEQGWSRILALLVANGVLFVGTMAVLGAYGRSVRRREDRLRAAAAP